MKEFSWLLFVLIFLVDTSQSLSPVKPLDNQCLPPHTQVQWRLRQDLSVDLFTALKAFTESFSNPKLPNFATRALVAVDTFRARSRKSWKSTHNGDYAFTDIGNIVTSRDACVRYTSERTRTDNGDIFDLDIAVSLERNGHGGISLILEMVSCSVRNNNFPAPLENFNCNENLVLTRMLTNIKRFACLIELFPFRSRLQICQGLTAGEPPINSHLADVIKTH